MTDMQDFVVVPALNAKVSPAMQHAGLEVLNNMHREVMASSLVVHIWRAMEAARIEEAKLKASRA
jgi:hypothetical protein